MTRIAELKDRLRRLAKRREQDGNYTDAALCEEAADALDSERAAHAETRRALDGVIEACNHAEAQALGLAVDLKTTEAALAEALKALDGLLKPFEGDDCRYDHHGYCQAHFLQEGNECCVKVARRVLEGGKSDE